MLGYYEWSNHSPSHTHPQPHPTHPPQLILPDDLHHDPSSQNHHRPIFEDPFTIPCTFPHENTTLHQLNTHTIPYFHYPLYDPTSSSVASSFPSSSNFNHHILQQEYPILVPKPDPEFTNRIGLNLGGRTYFASEDDLVSRLYRRTRGGDQQAVNTPKCQAEGCNADLTHAKQYHRRHKVCEFHSKASTVVAAGLTQRFCQQCSRFHLLLEFDNGKRSCRKRLADHNRRRRKSNQALNNHDQQDSDLQIPPKSPSQRIQRSTSDSGANSTSSITVAISSPLVSYGSTSRPRSYD